MAKRVSLSDEEQSLEEIAFHHFDMQAGLFEFFSGSSRALFERYAGAKLDEIRDLSLAELNHRSALSVLSSVEAAIRVDYLRRVYGRWRDPLSRSMRDLHQEKENRARLDEDLLRLWRERTGVSNVLLSELVGALNYRNWLAHGRYWTAKLGRRYDYESVYEICQEFIDAMDEYNLSYEGGLRSSRDGESG